MDNVLYFPHISIPETPWLTRSILYWNSVGSIIPENMLYRPRGLTPTMRKLVDAELVKPETPSRHTYKARNFTRAFMQFVDNDPAMLKLRSSLNIHGRYRHLEDLPFPSSLVHMEKLEEIAFELQVRGLAVHSRDENNGWGWFRVETTTAYYFMAYLATVIGAVANYQPATDKPMYLSALLGSYRDLLDNRASREIWRTKILTNLLPGPARLDSVDKLVSFKEKYGVQLSRFRNEIEQFILDLEAAPSHQHEERINRFISSALEQRDEISHRMREHKWSILSMGTLLSLGASALPLADSLPTGNYFEAIGAGLGIAAAFAAALSTQQLQEIKNRPMAYAVLTRSKLKLPDSKVNEPVLSEIDDVDLLKKLLKEQQLR